MSFIPRPGIKSAKALTAVLMSGALLFGAGAVPASATENQTSNAGDSALRPAAAAGLPFSDITWETQFAAEIVWVSRSGISTGWPDHTYRPLQPVSREAMAAFMHRLDALKGEKDGLADASFAFSDVANSQFKGEIGWLLASGVTTGYPDKTFRPGNPVNRDAMAAYLYRMAGYPEFTPPKQSPFADVSTDNQFYREISWLASTGISTGWEQPNGTRTFGPVQPVNRDAMAAFMYRFAEKGYVPKQ
ncbi:S-layer homology domain-containing protein [Arthrobacter sp. zg-Y238]|uniref:S-layer homology domain-containing protein n=1 Tax=Arthrobacter sp. zg-Y238 TaxID=2964614 RepID=UPI00210261A6|nr:S-layer homology domain-containing protein [Arthrobacter sp. zg-Y238]